MDKTQMIEKIADKIKGIRVTTFSTLDEKGNMCSRPMATQDIEFDGTVWFMTSEDSDKIRHITNNPLVGLSYTNGDDSTFVSLSGKAEILVDQARIKEFWNDFYKAWFDGPEDPKIRLIKVTIERAEYWDMPGGKIGQYASMAKAVLTGDKQDESEEENEVFELT